MCSLATLTLKAPFKDYQESLIEKKKKNVQQLGMKT
jgi:hypothetical protein